MRSATDLNIDASTKVRSTSAAIVDNRLVTPKNFTKIVGTRDLLEA